MTRSGVASSVLKSIEMTSQYSSLHLISEMTRSKYMYGWVKFASYLATSSGIIHGQHQICNE